MVKQRRLFGPGVDVLTEGQEVRQAARLERAERTRAIVQAFEAGRDVVSRARSQGRRGYEDCPLFATTRQGGLFDKP